MDEGVGFGVEEGDSKSAGEAKLRKRVAQPKSVLQGSPRINTEYAIKEKEVPGETLKTLRVHRGRLRNDEGGDRGLQSGSRLAVVLVSKHPAGARSRA